MSQSVSPLISLTFEQRTLLWDLSKHLRSRSCCAPSWLLTVKLCLHVSPFQRLHGFVVQVDLRLATFIDQKFNVHPLGFLHDSTVRSLMTVFLRVLQRQQPEPKDTISKRREI